MINIALKEYSSLRKKALKDYCSNSIFLYICNLYDLYSETINSLLIESNAVEKIVLKSIKDPLFKKIERYVIRFNTASVSNYKDYKMHSFFMTLIALKKERYLIFLNDEDFFDILKEVYTISIQNEKLIDVKKQVEEKFEEFKEKTEEHFSLIENEKGFTDKIISKAKFIELEFEDSVKAWSYICSRVNNNKKIFKEIKKKPDEKNKKNSVFNNIDIETRLLKYKDKKVKTDNIEKVIPKPEPAPKITPKHIFSGNEKIEENNKKALMELEKKRDQDLKRLHELEELNRKKDKENQQLRFKLQQKDKENQQLRFKLQQKDKDSKKEEEVKKLIKTVNKTITNENLSEVIRIPETILKCLENKIGNKNKYFEYLLNNGKKYLHGKLPENLGKTKTVRIPETIKIKLNKVLTGKRTYKLKLMFFNLYKDVCNT